MDEILAVGDEHFLRKSHAKMTEFKRSGKTIIVVTHDLQTLTGWCESAVWIDGGKVRMVGNPIKVVDGYRRAVAIAEEQLAAGAASPLSAPALALPELGTTTPNGKANAALPKPEAVNRPETGPAAEPGKRWGKFRAEVTQVRLLDTKGLPVNDVASDAPLTVAIAYRGSAHSRTATRRCSSWRRRRRA